MKCPVPPPGQTTPGELPAIYLSNGECSAFCTELEKAELDDVGANSAVVCRTNRALDTEDRVNECVGASPTGGGVCGSVCETYCKLFPSICSVFCEETPADCQVPDPEACVRQCDSLPKDGITASLPGGSYDLNGNYDGDTVQCRFRHLVAASLAPVDAIGRNHCGHANFKSNLHCYATPSDPPSCDDYCKVVVQGVCDTAGVNAVYENEEQCKAVCAAMDGAGRLGTNDDYNKAGDPLNTIGCRKGHAYNAFSQPDVHCTHAGPTGAPVCAEDPCESFCLLRKAACDANQDQAQCLTECQAIPGAMAAIPNYSVTAAKKGNGNDNDFNCRVLHVTRALSATGSRKTTECNIVSGGVRCPSE